MLSFPIDLTIKFAMVIEKWPSKKAKIEERKSIWTTIWRFNEHVYIDTVTNPGPS